MPILVTDGGYKFGLANQTNPRIRNYNQRTCIPDIRSGPATKRTRGISLVVRMTMAADDTHQAKLAEKCHYLPKRQNKCMSASTTSHGHK